MERIRAIWDRASMQGIVCIVVTLTVCGMAIMGRTIPEPLVMGFGAMITYLFVEGAYNKLKES